MLKKLIFFGGSIASSILIINTINDPDKSKMAFSLSQDPMHISKKWNNEWDIESTGGAKSKKPKATRHLILIRHGQYEMNAEDERCILTLQGREQAKMTGDRLKEYNFPYDSITHSSMTRAKETANIISKKIPQIKLIEDAGLEEGCPYINEPALAHWSVQPDTIKLDNKRIEDAFKRYFHRAPETQVDDSYTVLVCHANVIRYMLCRALQFPPEGWIRFSLDHGSISWVSIKPDGFVAVRCIGNSGFMPPDDISAS